MEKRIRIDQLDDGKVHVSVNIKCSPATEHDVAVERLAKTWLTFDSFEPGNIRASGTFEQKDLESVLEMLKRV